MARYSWSEPVGLRADLNASPMVENIYDRKALGKMNAVTGSFVACGTQAAGRIEGEACLLLGFLGIGWWLCKSR